MLKEKKPERLYHCLTEIKDGLSERKVLEENKSRALRWINLIDMDMKLGASKLKLKEWIKHRVPVRGDRILWGKPLVGRGHQDIGQENEPGVEAE